MVWGAMSFSGLTELHVIPQGQSVNQEYYYTEILEGNLFPRMRKNQSRGSKFDVKLVSEMSEMIFQQVGARAHTALRTQQLLYDKIPHLE